MSAEQQRAALLADLSATTRAMTEAREKRDALIVAALRDARCKPAEIQAATGLTRGRVYQIAAASTST